MPKKTHKSSIKTSAGIFSLEWSRKGLCGVSFPKGSRSLIGPLRSKSFSPLLKKLHNPKFDLSGATDFQKCVYRTLMRIPAGKTVTYSELAKQAGYPGAARAVGSAMRKNRLPVMIPCHRVVRADGSLGQYSAGIMWKRWLLKYEGAVLVEARS